MATMTSKYELSDEQRIQLIERARRELPELDRGYKEAIDRLRRFTKGTPRHPR